MSDFLVCHLCDKALKTLFVGFLFSSPGVIIAHCFANEMIHNDEIDSRIVCVFGVLYFIFDKYIPNIYFNFQNKNSIHQDFITSI